MGHYFTSCNRTESKCTPFHIKVSFIYLTMNTHFHIKWPILSIFYQLFNMVIQKLYAGTTKGTTVF